MITVGRSLELFFIDGRPDGMLTAEVFNWTGHVLRTPRTQIAEALKRKEADYTGVYLLLGEQGDRPRLYVGEAEGLRSRIKEHVSSKDWWDSAVLITTAADALHKAHVKYLESRLVEIAREVGAAELENGNTPTRSSLSEAARASMEAFVETLMMVLPAIRVDLFLNKRRVVLATAPSRKSSEPTFSFTVPRHGVSANAILRNGEMIVLSGSVVRPEWAGDKKHVQSYIALHDELIANGTIEIEGKNARFVSDFAFSSPSAAAAICAGTARNGRLDWRHTSTGKTFAEWEADQLNETAA